ncbi:MAG: hypothetical protein E6Q39_00025 [Crocinitomicaceae bacterium]|nr:MAG: hypothetical protein E6Q39_00025 [Crocinitomicaceae bacterium]
MKKEKCGKCKRVILSSGEEISTLGMLETYFGEVPKEFIRIPNREMSSDDCLCNIITEDFLIGKGDFMVFANDYWEV